MGGVLQSPSLHVTSPVSNGSLSHTLQHVRTALHGTVCLFVVVVVVLNDCLSTGKRFLRSEIVEVEGIDEDSRNILDWICKLS